MPSGVDSSSEIEHISPLLIAGWLLKPLPIAPLNFLLRRVAARIQDNHPAILARLAVLSGTDFLICPTDLPHAIRLHIGADHIDCQIEEAFDGPADVTIAGPFLFLIDLMDGKRDGDALFFSRSLTVTGNTEALLTLRNAIDSDDIDLRSEILAPLGLLKNPAEAMLNRGSQFYHILSRHMKRMNHALIQPLSHRCDGLEQENQALREKMTALEKSLRKTQNMLQSLNRKIKT